MLLLVSRVGISSEQRDLVERIGVLHDRIGFPPAAGRVVGLLLVSPEPELTFDQVRETLNLSKSSASTALNLLLRIGSVEYSTRPGDRKRYFRKRYDDWEESLLERFDVFLSLRHLLSESLDLKEGDSEESHRAVTRMVDFLGFLEGEIHQAHERWKNTAPAVSRST